ncbi:Outer membrane beta-barrel assembly protein BamE [hydrothermal vent metagenome]|uniref:Outer membrane beta-barrel assembly protein BamE n=1 Tax=hydrothermal vent metagenome TaxID=652676 RepID=A0A3B0YB83_9ZZZZ
MQKNLIIICLLTGLLVLLQGCEPHRIDIQQGNKVEPDTYEQLRKGMTRKQVIFLLGTPLLQDAFHQDRWDYIYYLKPGNEPTRQSRVTLHFKDDALVEIDGSAYQPEMHDNSHGKDPHESGGSSSAMGGGGGGGHGH